MLDSKYGERKRNLFSQNLRQEESPGPSLRPRLLDLRQRLAEALASADANDVDFFARADQQAGVGLLSYRGRESGPTATAAAAAAQRLLGMCRMENDGERQHLIADCLAHLFQAGLSAAAMTTQAAPLLGGRGASTAWREEVRPKTVGGARTSVQRSSYAPGGPGVRPMAVLCACRPVQRPSRSPGGP